MPGGDPGLFVAESDEDSVASDTTEESNQDDDHEYDVEKILHEEYFDGQLSYLIKWEGYPLARCTWEPENYIHSKVLLQEWAEEKRQVAAGLKEGFDITVFEDAYEHYENEKSDRKARRAAKRRKRERRRGSVQTTSTKFDSGSNGEDATGKPEPKKRAKVKSTPVLRKGMAQPVKKPRSKASPIRDDEDELAGADDDHSLPARPSPVKSNPSSLKQSKPAAATPTTAQKKKLPLPTSARVPQKKTVDSTSFTHTAGTAKKTTPPVSTTPTPGAAKKIPAPTKSVANNVPRTAPKPTVKPISQGIAPPAERTLTTTGAARKSAPSTVPNPPEKRTSTGNVFGDDWADPKTKRQRPRVSAATPKDSMDPKFSHLAIQNRYQKYANNEPAPDPSALTMVDPKSGQTVPPKLVPANSGPSEIPSAYRMRSPPRTTRVRTPSPSPPQRGRQSTPQMQESGRPIDYRKTIPCRCYQAGNCSYTADTCAYLHAPPEPESAVLRRPSYNAANDVTKKNTTCFYWQRGKCLKSEEECQFAHRDTGVYAGAPGTYRPGVGPFQAPTSHEADLRLIGETDAVSTLADISIASPNEPQTPAPAPLQVTTAPPTDPSTSPILTAPLNSAADSIMTGVTESPLMIAHPTTMSDPRFVAPGKPTPTFARADPRLIGRIPRTPQTPAEPILDPAVVNDGTDMPDAILDDTTSEEEQANAILSDLSMAKQALPKLDVSPLLTGKDGEVSSVMIHMPAERAGEVKVLQKHFQDLNCKVFTTQIDTHWSFVRKMTKNWKTCLLLLHPSETFIERIPELHNYLMKYGSSVRVYSIGVQYQQSIREGRPASYGAQRLFPYGGMTFISDDVFVYYPEKATAIIEQFLDATKPKPVGGEYSKIGARPGIKDWMLNLARRKFDEQGGEGKCTDVRWIQCYEALCRLCPIEEEVMHGERPVPSENSHLWSVSEDSLPSLLGRWESGDEAGATEYMVNHFAGEACNKAWKYRKFIFVYQRPEKEGAADPKKWMQKYCHIGVCSPEELPTSKPKK